MTIAGKLVSIALAVAGSVGIASAVTPTDVEQAEKQLDGRSLISVVVEDYITADERVADVELGDESLAHVAADYITGVRVMGVKFGGNGLIGSVEHRVKGRRTFGPLGHNPIVRAVAGTTELL